MNKSESKYFNTAIKMDEAFLELLEKKDFAYITVKEICERANVNRSTFYLHYETIEDLLSESVEYINEKFLAHMKQNKEEFMSKMKDCPLEQLYLITPDYLEPYLNYIKQNKKLFLVSLMKAKTLRLDDSYNKMFRYIFSPILERYQVPVEERKYVMAFYINGIIAMITQWLKNDCKEDIQFIRKLIQNCVMKPGNRKEKIASDDL